MFLSPHYLYPHMWLITAICFLVLFPLFSLLAQSPVILRDSTQRIAQPNSASMLDTGKNLLDSTLHDIKDIYQIQKKQLARKLTNAKFPSIAAPKTSLDKDSLLKNISYNPLSSLLRFSKPILKFNGGYVSYLFDYRSNIDTPYAEKNIAQHMLNGNMRFSVGNNIPLIANFWIRRSNSVFFRDINDVQIMFDAVAFHRQLADRLRQGTALVSKWMNDSVVKKMYMLKDNEWSNLNNWLRDPRQLQKLIECNETIKVPEKSYDPSLPDSTNKKNTDSLQLLAKKFIAYYNAEQKIAETLGKERDSLHKVYTFFQSKMSQYKEGIAAIGGAALSKEDESIANNPDIPPVYKWLMGVRRFAVGKSSLNYSELTAKNLNIKGINFEYNSWYYLAVSAGLMDYRFNDFVLNRTRNTPQPVYLFRAGLGHLDRNYFILSYYHGKKQLFGPGDSAYRYPNISISGVAAEAKWQLNSYSFIKTEVAQSAAPDYHYNPAKKTGFNLNDKTSQAYSVTLHSYIPETNTRVDALYKYTGANFQSFSSFQANSEWHTWNVRVEQNFFRRSLSLTAALQSNDFSNPYIIQNYKSNTVFKNFSVSYRKRGWPYLTLGYMPMSQLTMVGNQVVENRFQTLSGNISHYYKIGLIHATTVAVFNKFFNSNTDTSFLFYDATNWYVSQNFLFKEFSAGINISRSATPNYVLIVAGEEINFNFSKWGSFGLGLKINNFNTTDTRIGESVSLCLQTGLSGYLSLHFENSYLPSFQQGLLRNAYGNLQWVKTLR